MTLQAWEMSRAAFYKVRRVLRGLCRSRGYRLRVRDTVFTFCDAAESARMLAWAGAWRC